VKFNKLVRDKIPHILKQHGLEPKTYICSKKEYASRLQDKLKEEVNEFLKDDTLEELADILEVIYAIAKSRGTSKKELEKIRSGKKEKRGAFDKKIILLEAERSKPLQT